MNAMNEGLRAVRMEMTHLLAVAELERLCFSEPWSEGSLRFLLTDAAIGFVCMEDQAVTAYGGMWIAPDEGQITNIAVHPDHRRKGMGRAVTLALMQEARKMGLLQMSLEVRASNGAAIALYERLGFSVAGRRKHFYKNPQEDALVMIAELSDPKQEEHSME